MSNVVPLPSTIPVQGMEPSSTDAAKQPALSSTVNKWHIVEPRKGRPQPPKTTNQSATTYTPPAGSRFQALNQESSELDNLGSASIEKSAPNLFHFCKAY